MARQQRSGALADEVADSPWGEPVYLVVAVDELNECYDISDEARVALFGACRLLDLDPYARRVSLNTVRPHLPASVQDEIDGLLAPSPEVQRDIDDLIARGAARA